MDHFSVDIDIYGAHSTWRGANAMYEKHPAFEEPGDATTIWRYMDFAKFVSLLDKQALFFVRVDRLPDKFEGLYTRANINKSEANLENSPVVLKGDIPKLHRNAMERTVRGLFYILKGARELLAVNCWSMSAESAAMWQLYLGSQEGVAIESTFGRLRDSLDDYPEENVHIGKVEYVDYENDYIPGKNVFYPLLHKRKSYEHERELRAILLRLPNTGRRFDDALGGDYIAVGLDMLIERVFVSPTAPKWFRDLVGSILGKYGLKKEVVRSSLADGPPY